MSSINWLPLESNPDVMTKFLENLGVPKKWGISDIISLDDDLLQMVPKPVYAVLLLFPVSEKYVEYCDSQEAEIKANPPNIDPDVFFMLQTIRNACGTVALIHAVANNVSKLDLLPDSVSSKFLEKAKGKTPKERAEILEQSNEISAAHEECAEEGETETPRLEDKCNLHFITFVEVNSKLYELDGRKSSPVVHGSTSPDSFLQDAARICKEYMKRDPENVNFTALSFGGL